MKKYLLNFGFLMALATGSALGQQNIALSSLGATVDVTDNTGTASDEYKYHPSTVSAYRYAPEDAIDGDIADGESRWIYGYNGRVVSGVSGVEDSWTEPTSLDVNYDITFDKAYTITGYTIYCYDGTKSVRNMNFSYYDGTSWVPLAEGNLSENAEDNVEIKVNFTTPVSATKVRFNITANHESDYVRISEIEVYNDVKVVQKKNVALATEGTTVEVTDLTGTGTAGYTHYGSYVPENAIDGGSSTNTSSRWIYGFAGQSGAPTDLNVNCDIIFNKAYTITGYKFVYFYNNPSISDMNFSYYDGTSWVSLAEGSLSGNPADNREIVVDLTTPVSATKVRFNITKSNETDGYIRVSEIEVYALDEGSSTAVDEQLSDDARVYPNPVKGDVLTIQYSSLIKSVDVYNLSGRKVKTVLSGNTLDVSSLPSGLYMLNINGTKTIKFIKK